VELGRWPMPCSDEQKHHTEAVRAQNDVGEQGSCIISDVAKPRVDG
jgi:hypothetical protein